MVRVSLLSLVLSIALAAVGCDEGAVVDAGSRGPDAGVRLPDLGSADVGAESPDDGVDAGAMPDGGVDGGPVAEPDAGPIDPGVDEETVTADEGGEAAVALDGDDEAAVEVPPGAVDEETTIVVEVSDAEMLPEPEGDDAELVAEPVAFTPHGTAFEVPVTISFTIAGGVPEGSVVLRLDDEDDTAWELVESTVDGEVISAEVTGFSIYVVANGDVCHQDDPDSDGDGICDSEDPCAAPSEDTDGNGFCDDAEGRITGVVTTGGAPVEGVAVTLFDDLQNVAGETTTDATGAYALGGLTEAGSYFVNVADEGECLYGGAAVEVTVGAVSTADLSVGCF